MKKSKSSSGDTSYINPYMKKYVGQEVWSSKIVRKVIPYEIKIIRKIL